MRKITSSKTGKQLVLGLIFTAVFAMSTGCGAKENIEVKTPEPQTETTFEQEKVEEVTETVEESNAEEESVTSPFLLDCEKYESIISNLTTEQYYAFAGVAEDYDVLLVADGVYDNGDGNMVAIDAKVYGIDNGTIYEAGSVWSEGTAYPLAVYENSIMFGGNHEMTRACVRDAAVIIEKTAYEEFDDQGNVKYKYHNGDIDDIKTVEDDSVLSELQELYANAIVINFFPGEVEIVGDRELEDYPSNNFEARVEKYSFESYDEIIGLLQGEESYALVNIKGHDGEVLLVADSTFKDAKGNLVANACTPYTMKSTGMCTADSALYSEEGTIPVSLNSDNVVVTRTSTSIDLNCYGENGTVNKAIMTLVYAYVSEFDADGNPKVVGGFIRHNNSLIDDDQVSIEENEIDTYNNLVEESEKTTPIIFMIP